jgi:hypothetical protein
MKCDMKRISILGFLSLVLAGMAGCKQVEVPYPNVPTAVYIRATAVDATRSGVVPNTKIEFYNVADPYCFVVRVPVCMMGDTTAVRREVVMKQVFASQNEIEYVGALANRAIPLAPNEELLNTSAYAQRKWELEVQNNPELTLEEVQENAIVRHYVGFDHPKLMEYLLDYETYRIGQDVNPADGVSDYDTSTVNVAFTWMASGKARDYYRYPLQYPVLILKTPELKLLEKPVQLHMRLESNPQAGLTVGPGKTDARDYVLNYYIAVDYQVVQPNYWSTAKPGSGTTAYWGYWFGEWTQKKQEIIQQANPQFVNWNLNDPERDFPSGGEITWMYGRVIRLFDQMKADSPDGKIIDELTKKEISFPRR